MLDHVNNFIKIKSNRANLGIKLVKGW